MLKAFRTSQAASLGKVCAACTSLVALFFLARVIDEFLPSELPFQGQNTWAGQKYYDLRQKQVPILSPVLDAYRHFEWQASGALQLFGHSARLPSNVLFLPIDNASVQIGDIPPEELASSPALQLMAQGWPYPRTLYPMILDRLIGAGAKVVALDVLFPNVREGDEQFHEALEKYREHVVIGSNLVTVEDDQGYRPTLALPNRTLLPVQDGTDDRLGFVNFQKEGDDHTVRAISYRTTMLEYFHKASFGPELLSLSAQAARKAGFEALIPRDHRPRLLRFVVGEDLHPVSLHSIFSESLWAQPPFNHGALFKDKIVLIGPYGNWVKDELETPHGLMLGPQIHLSALSSLLNQDFLTESSTLVDLVVILAAGLTAWVLSVTVVNPVERGGALLGAAIMYGVGVTLLFATTGYWLKLFSPNLALLASGGMGLAWERIAEREERKRVRQTLERYVSRDVVKEVLDNPQSFLHTLGGERRPVAILFSDVRSFTTLTESADAHALVQQLNEYFTEMVRIVFEHHGTLDKFIGDSVMATWGGIVSRPAADDARGAVEAALGMLRELKRLNADWKARGLLELKVGVGVNHGEAICGHLGSEQKQEFSVIGDVVNLTSRLEGATKEFHVDLLIGEEVAALVRGTLTLRTVDLLQVKGKTRPVEVFTVLDEAPPEWLAAYEEGVQLYRQRAFTEAESALEKAAAKAPGDWLTEEYLRRARSYRLDPPKPAWDGVYVMTRK